MRWLVAVVAGAWGLALAVQVSGQSSGLHHDTLLAGGLSLGALALFALVWQVHIAAVMLPSSLPLMGRFGLVVARRPGRTTLWVVFLAGYVGVWTAFALVALAADGVLHDVASGWAWLDARPGLVLASALLVAGAYQFSGTKLSCLHACRRPDTFLRLHYRRGLDGALALGVRHGLFCVGCCWALMLVMVAVGIADLRFMAPLALVMVAEKVAPWGARLTAPVGWTLIALGLGWSALALV